MERFIPVRRHWPVLTCVGVLLLLVQLFAVVYEHTGPTRYFAWAPNDYAVEYHLQVRIHGSTLTPAEIAARYRLPQRSVADTFTPHTGFLSLYEAPVQQLIDTLRQREQTYGKRDGAQVLLRYRVDGRAYQEWQWPPR